MGHCHPLSAHFVQRGDFSTIGTADFAEVLIFFPFCGIMAWYMNAFAFVRIHP